MSTPSLLPAKMEKRFGFAGLFLLLFLVGMAMVVMVAWYAGAFNPFAPFQGTGLDRYADPSAQPWQEQHLFINEILDGYDMGGRRPPFPCQPKLKEELRYVSWVFDANNRRLGELQFTVKEKGDAEAVWTGQFEIGNVTYQLVEPRRYGDDKANVFFGNTAPLKIYQDESGLDHSKLYVITQGHFEMKVAGRENLVSGGAYVTAWIDKKHVAAGKVSILWFVDGKPAIFEWGPAEPTGN